MTNNTVYKAVVFDDETQRYMSVCHVFSKWDLDSHKVSLEYKIGQITVPEINKSAIYAFDTLKNTTNFLRNGIGIFKNSVFYIMECEYKIFQHSKAYMVQAPSSLSFIIDFWRCIGDNLLTLKGSAPSGTVLCKWVKPIKIVGKLYFSEKEFRKVYEDYNDKRHGI